MKFSSISTVSGLFALTSAQLYTETVPVVCSGAPPSTVTKTVTVTEGGSGSGGYSTGPIYPTSVPGKAVTSDYVTTAAGTVTSVNYDGGSKSTVWVYPTGSGSNKHCTVATYENNIVISVVIIDLTITINNGVTSTKTVTVTDSATYTPSPVTTISTATSSAPLSTGTGTSYGKIHHVTVGAQGLNLYSPNQLNASIGDTIRFNFLAKNHTVTQSDFNTPCTPNGGFDTGFNQFNPNNQTDLFVKDFVVNTTKPTWFHCAQTVPKSHCQAGMVLGINPAGKFEDFLNKAKNSGNATSTGTATGTATGTGKWISGVASPTGHSTVTSKPAVYTAYKGRSFQA